MVYFNISKLNVNNIVRRTPLTKEERLSFHKFNMLERRDRQLARVPDIDSRLRYYSKSSLPEYRKN